MPETVSRSSRVVQMASFRVGEEEYAIDIMRIREIIRPPSLTPVPDATGLLEGVINLRGAIIPVVDLRRRLGVPDRAESHLTRLVICIVQARLVAFRVDEVLEVVRLPLGQLRPAPRLSDDREPDLILGMCQHHDRLLLLLNLKRVLSPAFFEEPGGAAAHPQGDGP
jgi:purine-binding chemotaxis protein CheW